MGLLSDALPREQQSQEPTVKSDQGVYKAYFIGMSEKYTWVSEWPNEKCRMCGGKGTGRNGEAGQCVLCGGTGRKTETRVKLRYHLENNEIEEEEVNYKLGAGGGTTKGGETISPTKLFVRLRALMGKRDATEQEVDVWFSSLPQPPKVPCSVTINGGKYLKIESVLPRPVAPRNGAQAPQSQRDESPARQTAPPARAVTQVAQQPAPAVNDTQHKWAGDDGSFDDDSIPF
jgi:hypothetical protein